MFLLFILFVVVFGVFFSPFYLCLVFVVGVYNAGYQFVPDDILFVHFYKAYALYAFQYMAGFT